MLNIISRSIVSKHSRGPRKVVANLMRGLDELGVPYVVNRALDATDWLWVHDDPVALGAAASLPPRVCVIAGPNIAVTPRELPPGLPSPDMLWLYPAPWVDAFWKASGFTHERVGIWPVGINTDTFRSHGYLKEHVVVYVKQRHEEEVATVTEILQELNESYQIIHYGDYQEIEYQEALLKAKAILWVGRSESQGIALMEALAANVPTLAWDVPNFGHFTGPGKEKFTDTELHFTEATAIPYFSPTCGLVVSNADELAEQLPLFLSQLHTYAPRAFIETNHNLRAGAETFLNLCEQHFRAQPDARAPHTTALWRNATWWYTVLSRVKDIARSLRR